MKEGGFFYIAEAHPTGYIFDDEADHLSPRYDYFHKKQPELFEQSGSYAIAETKHTKTYEWTHSMGDIINALISAGLKIEFLHEFPFICWKMMPFLIQKENEW
ncbi:MAG: hypothetical protein ACFFDI_20985 [Promethearchaeota archaeon]